LPVIDGTTLLTRLPQKQEIMFR